MVTWIKTVHTCRLTNSFSTDDCLRACGTWPTWRINYRAIAIDVPFEDDANDVHAMFRSVTAMQRIEFTLKVHDRCNTLSIRSQNYYEENELQTPTEERRHRLRFYCVPLAACARYRLNEGWYVATTRDLSTRGSYDNNSPRIGNFELIREQKKNEGMNSYRLIMISFEYYR